MKNELLQNQVEVQALLADYEDGIGEKDFARYMKLKLSYVDEEHRIRQMFKAMDEKCCGYIGKQEFAHIMSKRTSSQF